MTDTPIQRPPTASERLKAFIGDLARPYAIIATSTGAAWATVTIAYKVKDGDDGAFFIGAVFAGVGTLFVGKAVEVFKSHQANARVAVAKAQAAPQPAPLPVPQAPVEVGDGELPASERVQP